MIVRQIIAIVILVFFAACAATIHAPAMASLKPLANPAGDAGLGHAVPPYAIDAYDISSGARVPGKTLEERIAFVQSRAQYAVDSEEGESSLRFEVNGVRFRVFLSHVVFDSESRYRFEIAPDDGDPCLTMSIDSHLRGQTGVMNASADCPFFPSQRSGIGNLTLSIIDKICSTFGAVSNELEDVAALECAGADGGASLAALHIMRTGETWYENHQYIPSGYDGAPITSERREEMDKHRRTLMTTTMRELPPTALERISSDAGTADSMMSDVLLRVWQENCTDYIAIVTALAAEHSDIGAAFTYFNENRMPPMLKRYSEPLGR